MGGRKTQGRSGGEPIRLVELAEDRAGARIGLVKRVDRGRWQRRGLSWARRRRRRWWASHGRVAIMLLLRHRDRVAPHRTARRGRRRGRGRGARAGVIRDRRRGRLRRRRRLWRRVVLEHALEGVDGGLFIDAVRARARRRRPLFGERPGLVRRTSSLAHGHEREVAGRGVGPAHLVLGEADLSIENSAARVALAPATGATRGHPARDLARAVQVARWID